MKSGIKECASAYAEKVGCSKAEAERTVKNVIDVIGQQIVDNGGVQFVGVFSIEVKERAAHEGRNPKTKEAITIPAHKTLKLKVGSALNKAING
jgi:DNA-binding protein HU-beta